MTLVFDYFHAAAFPKQPLGRSILGTNKTVASFTPGAVEGYMKRHYQPSRHGGERCRRAVA